MMERSQTRDGEAPTMRIHEDIVCRHAEDAAFLWSRRADTLRSCRLSHKAHARFDARLAGHLDGLRINGIRGEEIAVEYLRDTRNEAALFSVVSLCISSGSRHSIEDVLPLVDASSVQVRRAAVSALGFAALNEARPRFREWGERDEPFFRYLALAGPAVHRALAEDAILAALDAHDAQLRARACSAALEMGCVRAQGRLESLSNDACLDVARKAALAASRLGSRSLATETALRRFASGTSFESRQTAAALARRDLRASSSLIEEWSRSAQTRMLALAVAETVGSIEHIPMIISWMNDDDLARLAGSAFRTITGVDLEGENLTMPRPPRTRHALSDDPGDAHVEMDDEYSLSWPDPLKVARFWAGLKSRFAAGDRYLEGVSMGTRSNKLELSRRARPYHRTMAALDIAYDEPRHVLMETKSPLLRAQPPVTHSDEHSVETIASKARA